MGLVHYIPDAAERVFLGWETAVPDAIDLKRAYVDAAGDLLAGVLLSQVIHWFLPSVRGGSKLAILRQGRYWLAKRREDWWAECRLKPHQYDAAVDLLRARGLVQTAVFRFDGAPTVHIALCWEVLCARLSLAVVDVVPGDVAARLQPFPDVVLGAELARAEQVAVPVGDAPARLVELVLAPIHVLPAVVRDPIADVTSTSDPTSVDVLPLHGGKQFAQPVEFSRFRRLDFKDSLKSISSGGEYPITEITAEITAKATHPYPSRWEGSVKHESSALLEREAPGVRMAVAQVMAACGLATRRVERALADVVHQHCTRERMSPDETAAQMIAAWKDYGQCRHLIRCPYGPKNFYLHGHWLLTRWPLDQQLLRDMRVQAGARVGAG